MRDYLVEMNQMSFNEPVTEEEVQALENELKVVLPESYKEFLTVHNGGKGAIGEYGYLEVYGTKELVGANGDNKAFDIHPEYFCFASDRGGTEYAFDMNSDEKKIVEVPWNAGDDKNIKVVAKDFGNLIDYLFHVYG